jgi:polyphosphate kinase
MEASDEISLNPANSAETMGGLDEQDGPEFGQPSLYINREISLLEFNRRVLEQAKDPRAPLLERLRFLTICSTNLDEFFEIRVSGLKQQVEYDVRQVGQDGMSAPETLKRISAFAHQLVDEQYRTLNEVLLPALGREGIRILKREDWNEAQQQWVRRHFERLVLPVLTPMGLDPAHPFPRILNKSLNFVVQLEGVDAFGRDVGVAVVQVPRSLPRLIELPKSAAGAPHDFVMLSSIIHDQVEQLFQGMRVHSCHQFRVTRNSDLWVEEEEVDDLLHAIKGELTSRNYGEAVRLEVADDISDEVAQFLLERFRLGADDLYRVNGPVNLGRLASITEEVDRPDLKYAPFTASVPRRLHNPGDVFEVLKKGDIVLHHPFESFTPIVEFVRTAANDPDVLAIKQTLYRTGVESPLVDALLAAARSGKEVTAVVELRARFDEAANIDLATKLQEAGAKVVYGIVGYKAHAKMLLVVRREGRYLRRYVHLGTGNYHAKTARVYTDWSLLTLLKGLLEWLEYETKEAARGRPAKIVAKMNSLAEPRIIRALYRASRAGVSIDLIVRGICCLRPGVPGVSENIRVRSIIGRFLEHSRVFDFHHGGVQITYAASADWMPRNFFSRVETAFPIADPRLAARVVADGLTPYLDDDVQAWELLPDGNYARVPCRDPAKPRSAQLELLERRVYDRFDQVRPIS